MKPILFNTEMVRAILENRKTATRRVVKPRYCDSVFEMFRGELCEASPYKPPIDNGDGTRTLFVRQYVPCKPPYRTGDILYVRETFGLYHQEPGFYVYKADKHIGAEFDGFKWRPSIHMPRKAARIFLRGTGVKVQRVQDITNEECIAEGIRAWTKDGKLYKYYPADCEGDHPACDWQDCPKTPKEAMRRVWNICYSRPQPVKDHGVIRHYESYPWEDIQETRTYRGKPWRVMGNPWVWVIEFERCEKPTEGQA